MEKELLADWFKQKLSEELGTSKNEISLESPIASYRLDSLSSISLTQDLEDLVGFYIEPNIFSEFETIDDVIEWILQKEK
ncbi:acyl carrier protein [Dyadobacter diqingensis]|uniref:acyl carrier protein n=1 Tax=Dyadobacter diqingensis TaxID=2938121 RepID=UPI0020C44C17|nr:acyl carrier protein [Dyadobacter diqingensis]